SKSIGPGSWGRCGAITRGTSFLSAATMLPGRLRKFWSEPWLPSPASAAAPEDRGGVPIHPRGGTAKMLRLGVCGLTSDHVWSMVGGFFTLGEKVEVVAAAEPYHPELLERAKADWAVQRT